MVVYRGRRSEEGGRMECTTESKVAATTRVKPIRAFFSMGFEGGTRATSMPKGLADLKEACAGC